jgi:hypothetical protein
MDNEGRKMSNDELAQPATKGDIVRIHDKLDTMSASVTKLEGRPVYRQPCEYFLAHQAEHEAMEAERKAAINDWKKTLINGIVTIVVSVIAAYLIMQLGIKK